MLITRCPSCHTSFKVVPDQLRLGQGWVKCGKCMLAFHAEKHFVQTGALSIEATSSVETPKTESRAEIAPQAKAAEPPIDTIDTPPSALTNTSSTPPTPEPPLFPEAHKALVKEDTDAFDDDKLSPQTLFPADALDAMDELVALGAMRHAGTASAASETVGAEAVAPKPGFLESYPFPSTMPMDALIQIERQQLAAKNQATTPKAEGETAEPEPPTVMRPAGTLEAWRKSKTDRTTRKGKRSWSRRGEASEHSQEMDFNSALPPLITSAKEAPWHPESVRPADVVSVDVPLEEVPSFVAAARSRERWESWPVRILLLVMLAIGAAFAVAQAAYLNRHAIAAAEPSAAPWLISLCDIVKEQTPLPCDVLPLKRIEAMRVDSHTLAADLSVDPTTQQSGANAYVLSVTLKNQLELANAWPALDITFTDTTGAVQSRRVLQPRDYLSDGKDAALEKILAQGIKARDEQRVSVRFEAPNLRVGGYEITAFYP